MIHRESQQLFIGPYAIDAQAQRARDPVREDVRPAHRQRAAPHRSGEQDLLRHDGGRLLRSRRAARSAGDRAVSADEQTEGAARARAKLPGYHGKGLYSGQGRSSTRTTASTRRAALTTTRQCRAARSPSGTARRRLDSRPPQSVHRSHRPRRHLRQREARDRSDLEHRLGSSLAHPDAARRRQVARVPAAEGEPLLRRRARLEHRMAAHPRHRREAIC